MKVSVARRGGARGALVVLVRGWTIILALGVVFALGGYAYSWIQKPVYEASATVYITAGSNPVTSSYDSVRSAQERLYTYAQLVYSDAVLTPAIRAGRLNMTPDQAHSSVRVEVNPQLMMLTIAATDNDPEIAQRLSNAVSDSLGDAISKLDVPSGGGAPITRMSVITSAKVKPDPVAPLTIINVSVAALLGLIVGVLLVLSRERLNNVVRDLPDASRAVGARPLGRIPFLGGAGDDSIIDFPSNRGPSAEAIRSIRSRLLDNATGKILVTSAQHSEGVVPVSLNLGSALAQSGRRVVVVKTVEDTTTSRGWSDILDSPERLRSVLEPTGVDGLVMLPPGTRLSHNAADILSANVFVRLLDTLAEAFDCVIVEAELLVDGLASQAILPSVDRVVVVARERSSSITDLRTCGEILADAGSDVLGVVVCEFRKGNEKDAAAPAHQAVPA